MSADTGNAPILKTCSKCHIIKEYSFFCKRKRCKDGLNPSCKECENRARRERYRKSPQTREYNKNWENRFRSQESKRKYLKDRRAYVISQKIACIDCGESDLACIDFHHIDPASKNFNIGKFAKHRLEDVKTEIEKCICLCANCHRKRHKKDNGLNVVYRIEAL